MDLILSLPVAVFATGSLTPMKPARKSPFLPGGAGVVVDGGGGFSPSEKQIDNEANRSTVLQRALVSISPTLMIYTEQ